jgi:hypothetical protein
MENSKQTVVRHDLAGLHSLAVEPGYFPDQKADRADLLLITRLYHVEQKCGVVNGRVDTVAADADSAALQTVTFNPVFQLAACEDLCQAVTGKHLEIDAHSVSRVLPVVPIGKKFGSRLPSGPRRSRIKDLATMEK